MKRLVMLLPNGTTTLSSLIITMEMFEKANEYFISQGKAPMFSTSIVGEKSSKGFIQNSIQIHFDESIDHTKSVDLIIVPSLGDNLESAIKDNKNNIDWVISRYREGAEVASLCTGAFMLAAAGLLDGKQCSTHWSSAELFKQMFPLTDLKIERIITEEHGVYTTGGAMSSMNLVLHIIEKYYSRDTAIFCAKVFEIDIERNNQLPFVIFSGQKNHEDVEIRKAQQFMESNIGDKLIVDDLSARFSIDRRNFDRRFKKATGNTPLEYMHRVKVEVAKRTLEASRKTINEIMDEVGYSDVRAFREVFKKIAGMSPLDYRRKYNKEFSGSKTRY
ncbi:MAG TPA: helix-turn-helix domain-containing protein [Cyclobacteriaceae bacterium]